MSLWIKDALSFISGIQTYITIGFGVTTIVAGAGWYITNLKLDTAKEQVKTCDAERERDKKAYEATQEKAKADSLDKALTTERENAKQSQKADTRYDELKRLYDASIVRYKQLQIKRPAAELNLRSTTSTTSGSDTTRDSTEISISITDAGICAENTARLQAVQGWATGPSFKQTK